MLGNLVKNGKNNFEQYHTEILTFLGYVITNSKALPTKDNAIAALCKIG